MRPVINQTTTLGQMADQLRIHTKLQNYFAVGGVTGEPMAGIANRVMQMLLQRRMPWKFNTGTLSPIPYGDGEFMVNQQGWQDIKFAGASVFTLLPLSNTGISGNVPTGGVGVDMTQITIGNFTYGPMNGGTYSVSLDPTTGLITIQTLDPHPFQAANVNSSNAFLSGIDNPAFNSVYSFNNLLNTAAWVNGYNITAILDQYHIQVQGIAGEQYGSLTNIAASAGITTVTVPNTMGINDQMTFSSVATNAGLNGTRVTLLSASATQVTFATPAGVTITNGSDTGYIYAAPSGAKGIFHFGWLQAADIFDLNNQTFPMPLDQIKAVHRLSREYTTTGDKIELAVQKDFNNGVLQFRLSEPLSNYPFAIGFDYQKRAARMQSPGDVFPWPDDLSNVIFEMCLWQGMRFAYGVGAVETKLQMEVAQLALMQVLASEDREDNTMAMTPDWSIMK